MKRLFHQLKIVRTRKAHNCICCNNIIPTDSRVLVESGFNRDEGYFSNYFHIDKEHACHLDYLDACQPNDLTIPEKINNPQFFGELIFKKWKN